MKTDYMLQALSLARMAQGNTSPNPAVGAVIVKDGVIVGEGYTQPPGSAHAEIVALKQAGEKARGATLYVTLEPCCFHGRTPPCTQAIISAGIIETHIAMIDPNPRVSGHGISDLQGAGIKTFLGAYKDEAQEINEAFTKFITTGLPFITAKFAMSLDGKIATRTGESRWISSEESRKYVHNWRRKVDAVMAGVNTIIADDPQLTVRGITGEEKTEKQPLRVIVDSRGRTPLTARVLKEPGKTIIAVSGEIAPDKAGALARTGAEVLTLPSREDMVDLEKLLKALGQRGVTSLLAEGGSTLFGSLFEQGLVDRLLVFIAPIIIGGSQAKSPVGGKGIEKVAQAKNLNRVRVDRFGGDVLITGYMRKG